jgi:hypothetical protein
VGKLLFYRFKPDAERVLWRIAIPEEPSGYRRVSFRRKADAARFYRARRRELKASGRDKAVDFLTSGHKLADALGALRLLRDKDRGPWQNRLRRSASLLAMLEENIARTPGPFVEPASRALELPPDLYRLVVAFARKRGVNVNNLVAGLLSEWVKKENEASAGNFEEREGRARLGDLSGQRVV